MVIKGGTRYLFPFLVRLNGPTISIAILLNGSLMIGVFTIGTLTLSLFDVLTCTYNKANLIYTCTYN
jgi:hypothetical protein